MQTIIMQLLFTWVICWLPVIHYTAVTALLVI